MTYQPKHRSEPRVRYQISVMESERGWGSEQWVESFDTREAAEARIEAINSKNTSPVAPDYYMKASKTITVVPE